jgi:N-acetylglucosaminyldiphosphoundecaprenol N-acetyl-beta-D-mannosaminyltransferase
VETSVVFSRFLGFQLASLTASQLVETLVASAASRTRARVVCYLNAAQVNLAFTSPAFARALERADLLYADGQAVVWGARLLGQPVPERVSAADFAEEFAVAAARAHLRLGLVGGRPDLSGGSGPQCEAGQAAKQLRRWAPNLDVVAVHHGYLLSDRAEADALETIKTGDPHLVMVGMGAPTQEEHALHWRSIYPHACVWWCVGALFEFIAGVRPRAPNWMRQAGLEWSFRLVQEPSRLWRRYLVGNPLYMARVLRGRPPPSLRER